VIPPIQIREHEGFIVVRDDLITGGTKARALPVLMAGACGGEYVYASPAVGYAQVALAHTAKAHGKKATIFCAHRQQKHSRTLEAAAAGAEIHEVRCGYMSVVRARAADYCRERGAKLLPFGLDDPAFIGELAKIARSATKTQPSEVWCAAGSGVLCRALQQAWPSASVNAVRVGAGPNVGAARLFPAPETFGQDAKVKPPFPSCSNYDAKVWRFIKWYGKPGALFWNVAA
jgi:hypothetical protein